MREKWGEREERREKGEMFRLRKIFHT